MSNSSGENYIAAVFDSFAYVCPHFTAKTDINGGYGCQHLKQDMDGQDYNKNPCGSCMLGGCPLGYSADAECLNNPAIDWQGEKPDPADIDGEYIIVNRSPDATDEEKAAAENYIRYINRYLPKEEAK